MKLCKGRAREREYATVKAHYDMHWKIQSTPLTFRQTVLFALTDPH
jgi:hypothetical protein